MGHLFILFILLLLLLLLLAAMTYNQVHYFQVNHLADFTQTGHTKISVGYIDLQTICMGCPVLIHLEVNLSQHSNTVLYNNAQYYSILILQCRL